MSYTFCNIVSYLSHGRQTLLSTPVSKNLHYAESYFSDIFLPAFNEVNKIETLHKDGGCLKIKENTNKNQYLLYQLTVQAHAKRLSLGGLISFVQYFLNTFTVEKYAKLSSQQITNPKKSSLVFFSYYSCGCYFHIVVLGITSHVLKKRLESFRTNAIS